MSEATSTTSSTAQRAGVVAHALHALADHIDQHHLPEPGSIEIEADRFEFSVQATDAYVWGASLDGGVDEFTQAPLAGDMESCTVTGRLPNSGVNVVITWVQLRTRSVDYLHGVTR